MQQIPLVAGCPAARGQNPIQIGELGRKVEVSAKHRVRALRGPDGIGAAAAQEPHITRHQPDLPCARATRRSERLPVGTAVGTGGVHLEDLFG